MRRLWIAVRVFFVALFNREVADRVQELLNRAKLPGPAPPLQIPKSEIKKPEPKKPEAKAPVRSEALTLLATLQREARLVDFLKEPLVEYTDAQIGAVARDVHRDCGKVLDRLFALAPVVSQEEGTGLEVPAGFDAGRYRLAGNVVGEPPFRGRLVHHGWEATKCDLPAWTGSASAARIVAPVEVEL
jgi:Domain of unknown function (DUF2760)